MLSELESELVDIDVELMRYKKPEDNQKELIDFSLQLLQKNQEVWNELEFDYQHRFQKVLFPDGVIYTDGNFTTTVKPFTVQINEALDGEDYTMVTPRRIELRLPG